MRFDVERILALAREWPSPRLAGSDGERRAADQINAHLERAGLGVERIVSERLWWTRLIALTLCCLNMATVAAVAQPGVSRWLRAASFAVALVTLIAAFGFASRRIRAAGLDSREGYHIIGRPTSKKEPAPKLVFVTRLDTDLARPALPILGTALYFAFVLLPLLCLTAWYEREAILIPALGRSLFVTEWFLAVVVVTLWPMGWAVWPGQDDNGSGLALLVELARNRQGAGSGRLETWFVATSEPIAIAPELRRLAGNAPLLVCWLHAPGSAEEVTISGTGTARRYALQAARDLWIPHRPGSWLASEWMSLIYESKQISYVRVGGSHGGNPINPRLLVATGQLAAEIGLRWAKQAELKKPPVSTDAEL